MFILVEFTDTKEVAVIPDNWLDGTSCSVWPVHVRMTSKLNGLVVKKCQPESNWPSFPIKELYRNESYNAVRSKLKKSEEDSDLATTADYESDENCVRKSKRKRFERVMSSDEEEEELLQRSPKARFIQPPTPPTPTPPTPTPPTPPSRFNSPSVNRSVNALERDTRLFSMLEKLNEQQADTQDMIRQIWGVVRCSTNYAKSATELPEGMEMPIKTQDEMLALETSLEDTSILNGLITFLSALGGRNRADITRRIMRAVLTNEMATKYNWYGLRSKFAFKSYRLSVAVQKAVMKACTCTATDVELDVREWLRLASDRDGGRKKRAKSATSTSADTSLDNE